MHTFYDQTADILRHVYDEVNKRLRVDTELTLTGNVIIEKVKIEDPCAGIQTNDVKVTLDGEDTRVANLPSEGSPKHYNGSVGTTPVTVTFTGSTKSIFIENTNGGKELFVSFDGGTNWKRIRPNSALGLDGSTPTINMKGSGTGVSYEILTVE